VTVIAEARHTSPDPETHRRDSLERSTLWNVSKILEDPLSDLPNYSRAEQSLDQPESSNFLGYNSGVLQPSFPAFVESYNTDTSEETLKGPAYPPFPCPFCDRAYTSWGFRRRHIKAVHTISPSLNCKWCLQVSLVELLNQFQNKKQVKLYVICIYMTGKILFL